MAWGYSILDAELFIFICRTLWHLVCAFLSVHRRKWSCLFEQVYVNVAAAILTASCNLWSSFLMAYFYILTCDLNACYKFSVLPSFPDLGIKKYASYSTQFSASWHFSYIFSHLRQFNLVKFCANYSFFLLELLPVLT